MPMPPYPPAMNTITWNFSYGTGGGSFPCGSSRNIGLWTTIGSFFGPNDAHFWFSNICDYTAHVDPSYNSSLAPWQVTLESFPFINRALLGMSWLLSGGTPGPPQVVPLPAVGNSVETAEQVLTRMDIFGLPDFYDVTFKAGVNASDVSTELHTPYGDGGPSANPTVSSALGVMEYPLPDVPFGCTATLVPGDTVGAYTLGFDVIATKLAWWWQLTGTGTGPNDNGRDDCGNLQPKAPYIYTPFDPSAETGAQWEKFDPTDPTAHPTPVILSIEPNHGPVAGNESIIIRGSGFGTEATVTFDGVAASDVNVVSREEIQVVNPPHLAGFAAVVVTNFDGVSS